MKKTESFTAAVLASLLVMVWAGPAGAHVFMHHAQPPAGAQLTASPQEVRITFDGDLEAAFSRITVKDAGGKQVDKADGRVDTKAAGELVVSLPQLAAGTYRVFWSVVGRDGHRTEGDYQFTLR